MAGEIEFLPQEPDEGRDDELAAAPIVRPRPRWLVWTARVAVVMVIGAAALIWAVTRPGEPAKAPAAAASKALPHPAAPPPTVASTHYPPIPDSAIVMCREGTPAKPDVVSAMRTFLPKIAVDTKHAYVCHRGYGITHLAGETITGIYHGLGIKVDLSPPGQDESADFAPEAPATAGRPLLLGRVEAESAALTIAISAYGRAGGIAPMDRLRQLGDYISLNLTL